MTLRPLAVLAALAIAALAAPAWAQLRTIPDAAQRGFLRHVSGPLVELNNRAAHLAPGAQIRDPGNRIVLPAALPSRVEVLYTVDRDGMIDRVWIPTPAERARHPASAPYTTPSY